MPSKRMLIDAAHPEETRVVVIDGSRLEEFDVEVASRKQLKGNIYLAKITRVEPSLQAAFVDYGGNRHGFLAFNEIHPDYYQIPVADRERLLAEEAALAREAESRAAAEDAEDGEGIDDDEDMERRHLRSPSRHYKIQEVIKRRQIMLVQVAKEERGNKGAALTTYLSLAGRYCVLMPNTARGGGISRKITTATDRKRLKKILTDLEVPEGMAVIVRTAGSGRSKAEIKRDYEYLLRLWSNIRETTLESTAPALVYEEGSLIKRSIRDHYERDIEEIIIQGEVEYKIAREFMKLFIPSHAKRVKLYEASEQPLYQGFHVEDQLDAMHQPIVQLRSGGYLVINPTEALVTIDVNSGRATRERHIEETALRTNLEAADEVGRQLRLRDLAGLIVIDFIDMEVARNQAQVERRLKEAMKGDRARTQIGRISTFGLLELSRQRLRPSLLETSFEVCSHCRGAGVRRTTESTALAVLRKIEEEGSKHRSAEISVAIPTAVALYLLNQKRRSLITIEERFELSVAIIPDDALIPPDCHIERIRAVGARSEDAVPAVAPATAVMPVAAVVADEPAVEEEPAEVGGERDDAGKRGRRRRGRRRRRSDDETLPLVDASGEASLGDAAFELANDEDEDDEDDEALDDADDDAGEADEEVEEVEAEALSEPAKKRRRRGKRGGRRRSRRPGDRDATQPMAADDGMAMRNGMVMLAIDAETGVWRPELGPDMAEETTQNAVADATMTASGVTISETATDEAPTDEAPADDAAATASPPKRRRRSPRPRKVAIVEETADAAAGVAAAAADDEPTAEQPPEDAAAVIAAPDVTSALPTTSFVPDYRDRAVIGEAFATVQSVTIALDDAADHPGDAANVAAGEPPASTDAPLGEVPESTDAPLGGVPESTDAPLGEVPESTDAPLGEVPESTDAPLGEVPESTDAPLGGVPESTDAPLGEVPESTDASPPVMEEPAPGDASPLRQAPEPVDASAPQEPEPLEAPPPVEPEPADASPALWEGEPVDGAADADEALADTSLPDLAAAAHAHHPEATMISGDNGAARADTADAPDTNTPDTPPGAVSMHSGEDLRRTEIIHVGDESSDDDRNQARRGWWSRFVT